MAEGTFISRALSETRDSFGTKVGRAIKRRLPIFQWFPKYKPKHLIGDFISGLTVGMTAVPQGMAYAVVAGLPPEYGLYSAFVPPLVYVFLGSCRQVTIGPTGIIALLAFETCGEGFSECIILTTFYSGVIELLLSILGLGILVSLISDPVTVGFTAGAAITVVSSQLKTFFGFKGDKATGFLGYWRGLLNNFGSISLPDTILGITSVLFLIFFQKLNLIWKPDENTERGRMQKKILWVLSVSRNILVCCTGTLIAYLWGNPPFALTGHVRNGFPPFSVPEFLLPDRRNTTGSIESRLSFSETLSELGTGPFVIALIAILQNVAISKIFGTGQKIDGNQEMLAAGVSNVIASLFSSQPVSGSFTRSVVNDASGVRSPLTGIFTGGLIIFSLTFLTPVFYYIPKASLAAIIMTALLSMIEYNTFLPMWRISKPDVFACAVTFITSLLIGMEFGIGIGVAISIGMLLFHYLSETLIPTLMIDPETGIQYVILRPTQGIKFPNVDIIRQYVNQYALELSSTHSVIVLDCLKWSSHDFTAVTALVSLVKALRKNGQYLVLLNCDPDWSSYLKWAGLSEDELNLCLFANEEELSLGFKKSFSHLQPNSPLLI